MHAAHTTGACEQRLEACTRSLCSFVTRVVNRDDVSKELCRVVVRGACVAERFKVCQRILRRAAVEQAATGQQKQIIEEVKDAASRLVDAGNDRVPRLCEGLQGFHHLLSTQHSMASHVQSTAGGK